MALAAGVLTIQHQDAGVAGIGIDSSAAGICSYDVPTRIAVVDGAGATTRKQQPIRLKR
jgi:hypothetical protein